VQQKSNGKRMTYLFADTGGIKNGESQNEGGEDAPLTEQDIIALNEYSKRPEYVKEIYWVYTHGFWSKIIIWIECIRVIFPAFFYCCFNIFCRKVIVWLSLFPQQCISYQCHKQMSSASFSILSNKPSGAFGVLTITM
jgi:hypothetical protein